MPLTMILGGAAAPLIGKLADIYSVTGVLRGMAVVPLLTLPLILLFPKRGQMSRNA